MIGEGLCITLEHVDKSIGDLDLISKVIVGL